MNTTLKQFLTAWIGLLKPITVQSSRKISSEEAEDIAYDWLIQDALGG